MTKESGKMFSQSIFDRIKTSSTFGQVIQLLRHYIYFKSAKFQVTVVSIIDTFYQHSTVHILLLRRSEISACFLWV